MLSPSVLLYNPSLQIWCTQRRTGALIWMSVRPFVFTHVSTSSTYAAWCLRGQEEAGSCLGNVRVVSILLAETRWGSYPRLNPFRLDFPLPFASTHNLRLSSRDSTATTAAIGYEWGQERWPSPGYAHRYRLVLRLGAKILVVPLPQTVYDQRNYALRCASDLRNEKEREARGSSLRPAADVVAEDVVTTCMRLPQDIADCLRLLPAQTARVL